MPANRAHASRPGLLGNVVPPPGLDPLTPAKVHLKDQPALPPFPGSSRAAHVNAAAGLPAPDSVAPYYTPQTASPSPPYYTPQTASPSPPYYTPQTASPSPAGYMPQTASPSPAGGWFNAVLSTAAHLDKQGLEQALSILDHAIQNVQYAKAMENIITTGANTRQAPPPLSPMPQLVAAELWRSQVCREQQQLLQRLLALRQEEQAANAAAGAAMAEAAAATAPRETWAQPAMMQSVHPARRQQHATGGADGPRQEGQAPMARLCGRQVQTLSTSLQLLANEDPECLFIVRRINKLGFKASRKLKQHFAKFGVVARVLVAHSTVRQHGDPQCYARRRPSSLGFVHMASGEAVKAILALGEEQEVDSSLIRVQRFERQRTMEGDEEYEEVENYALDKMGVDDWLRQHTTSTTASAASLESNSE